MTGVMTTNSNHLIEMNLKINLLFSALLFIISLSSGLRLNPLENNDKLQSINNQYIAEWQWESWPIKQDVSEREVSSPGPRMNAALWKDNNGLSWFLFGGQPVDTESKKIYSDIWKYSTVTRIWEKVFPLQDYRGKYKGKIGGLMTLRINVFDEESGSRRSNDNNGVLLCGRSAKRNATKVKKTVWSNFSRRKKEEARVEESKSLAVYRPKTSKSNTVWQIDLKDKVWTAYVCCCDTSNNERINPSQRKPNSAVNFPFEPISRNETNINLKIDRIEDEIDNEQEHMTIENRKKKKINQMKKKGDPQIENDVQKKKKKIKLMEDFKYELDHQNDSRRMNVSETLKNFSTEALLLSKNQSDISTIIKSSGSVKTLRDLKIFFNESKPLNGSESTNDNDANYNTTEMGKAPAKLVSKYCPDFTGEEEPVTWCDGNNDVLITTDLSASRFVLWLFNLKTSHWSQQLVDVIDDIQWPPCSNTSSVRYAGAGEEVYVLCSPPDVDAYETENVTWSDSVTDKSVFEMNDSTKLVYRINGRKVTMESLGKIKLDKIFKLPHGKELWRDESKFVVQVLRLSPNETILLMAYKNLIDLWILMKNDGVGYQFEPVESIWRGSAQKWFNQYNSPMYNLQFISDGKGADSLLILNPRQLQINEYWPRERGRFIVRILKNENIKSVSNHNSSFENQTREHNLTYDLLQSDLKSPINDSPFAHSYNIKVLIFFGISLAIFAIFGVIIFLKKCVNCPSRMLINTECHNSPPVVRYSVIREDLLYPAA